ncbi:MAG: redoxin domain-containing protein [Proteobacteria bacterium]|nr:redoxin domain-containing protein [Pseudomonadota bacterium]TDJ33137.1 MAG: peroxiredoxin family protein [Gammaproteobacteria bacterium]
MGNTIYWLIGIVAVAGVLFALRDKLGGMLHGRPVPDNLKPGQPLPDFQAVDEDGNRVSSSELAGTPAILLFVRGSWCPFCSKQVADLTKVYKEITDSGAKLILVTPKPLATTRRVAEIFEVDFQFWLDDSLEIVKKLGLLLEAGVPDDHRKEYGEDTLWPTSLVIDSKGIIRFTALSRFITDRPNPEKLLKVLRNL